jgi:hypothetical protein
MMPRNLNPVARMEPLGRLRPSSTGYGVMRDLRFPDYGAARLHPGYTCGEVLP